jgi:hypothetical protein
VEGGNTVMKFQGQASQPWRTLIRKIEKPFTGLMLTVGLVATGSALLPAYSEAANRTDQPLADGVYLYGQSPQPNTIGSEYLVFEVNQGQVIGGFYMPSSSFDCFYGSVEAQKLALTVVDSYEQTPHPYAVALQSESPVASAGNEAIGPVGLEGYHRIENLSGVDHQVLNTCKADHNQTNPNQNQTEG